VSAALHDHHYPRWIPWCTSEYTMPAIREMRDKAKAEGYLTRVDHKGTHLAGDGTRQPFGKLFIRCTCSTEGITR
jgi:hypothetical protein